MVLIAVLVGCWAVVASGAGIALWWSRPTGVTAASLVPPEPQPVKATIRVLRGGEELEEAVRRAEAAEARIVGIVTNRTHRYERFHPGHAEHVKQLSLPIA
jgi:hypothetical protein